VASYWSSNLYLNIRKATLSQDFLLFNDIDKTPLYCILYTNNNIYVKYFLHSSCFEVLSFFTLNSKVSTYLFYFKSLVSACHLIHHVNSKLTFILISFNQAERDREDKHLRRVIMGFLSWFCVEFIVFELSVAKGASSLRFDERSHGVVRAVFVGKLNIIWLLSMVEKLVNGEVMT
jgi:hypothetical protein